MPHHRDMPAKEEAARRNRSLAWSMAGIAIGMVCLSFAAVPLYDLFCRVTGYDGTTRRASVAPEHVVERVLDVRFNADTAQDLPWEFHADQPRVSLKIGEERLVTFTARNHSDQPVYGTAIYNVTPLRAGQYFNKIECFCFENQRLEPGQEMHMPVSFFIDPALADDPYLRGLTTVTLSYTFFLSKNQKDDKRAALE